MKEVATILDYFKILQAMNKKDFYARGENEAYQQIEAPCFRHNIKGVKEDGELFVPLLEVTNSPLIALYYACQPSNKGDKGYVHFFPKAYCLPFELFEGEDLNNTLSLTKLSTITLINLVNYLSGEQEGRKKVSRTLLIHALQTIQDEPKENPYLFKVLEVIRHTLTKVGQREIDESNLDSLLKELVNEPFLSSERQKFEKKLVCTNERDLYLNKSDIPERSYSYGLWWVFIMEEFLFECNRNKRLFQKSLLIPPVVLHSPIFYNQELVKVKTQFYQLFGHKKGEGKPFSQRLVPEVTVKVSNKQQLLKELALLGVDENSVTFIEKLRSIS